MSNDDLLGGNPNPTTNNTKMMPLLVIIIISVLMFIFMDLDWSYLPITKIMTIMLIFFILIGLIRKKHRTQDQTLPMNEVSTPPTQGIIDQSLEEKRIMAVATMQKFSKIISYAIIPFVFITSMATFIILGFSEGTEYELYFGMIIPIFAVPIILILFAKKLLPQLSQRLMNDPRFHAGTPNNPPKNDRLPSVPINNKQLSPNYAKPDNYTKEGAKIQQYCPFCGQEFYGKRDSCPKCKKII